MRTNLRPSGLIRLFSKQSDKPEGKRPQEIDPDDYEVTPYGRRLKRRGLRLTVEILAVGAAAAVVWMLV